ncbi:MAG: peptide chain release factor N(5)-glutamine methyltransferase [Anaerolineales bacterium]
MTVGEWLERAAARLRPKSETAALDAQVLLAKVTGRPRTWLLTHLETPLPPEQETVLRRALTRLQRGEPLPYVLGEWEFFDLSLLVTPQVLIPRPETELLVERALSWLRAHPGRRRLLDVGTGSGAIAVALAANVPDLKVLATDISSAALEVARRNAARLGVAERIEFAQWDLLPPEPLPAFERFDVIAANLPYIPTDILHTLPVYRREPTLALDGGRDGLDLVRRLLAAAPAWLAPAGLVVLEIEASQGPAAMALAFDLFARAEIHLHRDLSGHDRLLEILA